MGDVQCPLRWWRGLWCIWVFIKNLLWVTPSGIKPLIPHWTQYKIKIYHHKYSTPHPNAAAEQEHPALPTAAHRNFCPISPSQTASVWPLGLMLWMHTTVLGKHWEQTWLDWSIRDGWCLAQSSTLDFLQAQSKWGKGRAWCRSQTRPRWLQRRPRPESSYSTINYHLLSVSLCRWLYKRPLHLTLWLW